jgi:hypothetical protein
VGPDWNFHARLAHSHQTRREYASLQSAIQGVVLVSVYLLPVVITGAILVSR